MYYFVNSFWEYFVIGGVSGSISSALVLWIQSRKKNRRGKE